MPQPMLYEVDRSALLQKVDGDGVPQNVKMATALGQISLVPVALHDDVEHLSG